MANENKKDFNSMLKNNKDMPKTQIVTAEKTIKRYGETKMFFAPPIYYDKLIKKVPKGKLVTVLSNPDLDFTRKTIRVVTTHEGSGLGNVVNDVKKI